MAEYIVSNKHKDNEYGTVGLSTNVFESIAKASLEEISNVALADSSFSRFKKSISCKVVRNSLAVTLNVLAKTGANVNKLCDNIQEKLHDDLIAMTSFKDVVVNVNVVGFYGEQV